MGTYVFRWPHLADHVYVTGTFDDWGKTVKLDKVGDVFEKEVSLPSAHEKILYKFVVDDMWITNHDAPIEDDGYYNVNNVVFPSDIKSPITAIKGKTALSEGRPTAASETSYQVPLIQNSRSNEGPVKQEQGPNAKKTPANVIKGQIPDDFDNKDWQLVNDILGALRVSDDADSIAAQGDTGDGSDTDNDTIRSLTELASDQIQLASSNTTETTKIDSSQASNYYGSTLVSDNAKAILGNVSIEKHHHHYPPPNALPHIESEPEQAQAFIAAVFQAASQYKIPMPKAPTQKDPSSIAQWVQDVYEAHMCATSIADGQTAIIEGSIGTSGMALIGSEASDEEASSDSETRTKEQMHKAPSQTAADGQRNTLAHFYGVPTNPFETGSAAQSNTPASSSSQNKILKRPDALIPRRQQVDGRLSGEISTLRGKLSKFLPHRRRSPSGAVTKSDQSGEGSTSHLSLNPAKVMPDALVSQKDGTFSGTGSDSSSLMISSEPPEFHLKMPSSDKKISQMFDELIEKRGWTQSRRQMQAFPISQKWILVYQQKLFEWHQEQKTHQQSQDKHHESIQAPSLSSTFPRTALWEPPQAGISLSQAEIMSMPPQPPIVAPSFTTPTSSTKGATSTTGKSSATPKTTLPKWKTETAVQSKLRNERAAKPNELEVGDILLVRHDFTARSPDEMTLRQGERVILVELDTDFGDGWYLGERQSNGDKGLFPGNYVFKDPDRIAVSKMPLKKVIIALSDYEPPQDKAFVQLRFYKGEHLHVIGREDDEGWYEARNPLRPHNKGLVPVEFFKDQEPSSLKRETEHRKDQHALSSTNGTRPTGSPSRSLV